MTSEAVPGEPRWREARGRMPQPVWSVRQARRLWVGGWVGGWMGGSMERCTAPKKCRAKQEGGSEGGRDPVVSFAASFSPLLLYHTSLDTNSTLTLDLSDNTQAHTQHYTTLHTLQKCLSLALTLSRLVGSDWDWDRLGPRSEARLAEGFTHRGGSGMFEYWRWAHETLASEWRHRSW